MRLCTSILAIACLIGVSNGQQSENPEPWANKLFGNPDNLYHDFGKVPHGTLLKHEFKVTNIYKVPLEITEVRCGLGALIRAEPNKKSLQPNEKALITVTMDTRFFNGARTVRVFVTFGPKYVSQAALTLSAYSTETPKSP